MRVDYTNRTLRVEMLPRITQGENNAHAEVIPLPRTYAGYDVSKLVAVMRATWPEYDAVMDQILSQTVEDTQVLTVWRVTSDFTAYAGEMLLELRLFDIDSENPVVKFPGATAVEVRESDDHSDVISPNVAEALILQAEASVGQGVQAASLANQYSQSAKMSQEDAKKHALRAEDAGDNAEDAAANAEKAARLARQYRDQIMGGGMVQVVDIAASDAAWTQTANGYTYSVSSAQYPAGVFQLVGGTYHEIFCNQSFDGSIVKLETITPFDGMMLLRVPDARKMDKLTTGVEGHIPLIGSDGNLTDSGRAMDTLGNISGEAGPAGKNGDSAYQIAVKDGFEGSEEQWLESLVGARGKSAYEYARDGGYAGTEAEFAQMLASPPGEIHTGSYVGSGTEQRTISVGFTPKAGIVFATGSTAPVIDSFTLGYAAVTFGFFSQGGYSFGMYGATNGFTVDYAEGPAAVPTLPWLNKKDVVYVYFAWR